MALYRETATGFVCDYATAPGTGYTAISAMPTDTVANRVAWWRTMETNGQVSNWHPSIQSNPEDPSPLGLNMDLSQWAHLVSASPDGTVVDGYLGASTVASVFRGPADVTTSEAWGFTYVAANCTVTQSTNTFTVTAMSADTATVTITATRSGSPNQVAVFSLAKAKQGTAGAAGAAGTRGSQQILVSGTAWSDSAAWAGIVAQTGTAPVLSDMVTIADAAAPFSQSKFYAGGGNGTTTFGTWNTPTAYINGNLLVTGTVGTNQIAANSVTAGKIDSRGLSIKDASGNIILAAGTPLTSGNMATGIGGNQFPNSDLLGGTAKWAVGWVAGGGTNYEAPVWDLAGVDWRPGGIGHTVGAHRYGNTQSATGWFDIYYTTDFAVKPSSRYEVSGYLAAHRNDVYLVIGFYKMVSGTLTWITEQSYGPVTTSGGQDLSNWTRTGGFVTTPLDCTSVRIWLRGSAVYSGQYDPYYWGTRFYFGEATATQTELSSWSASSGGIFSELSQINSGNISTYIANAAITTAVIGDAVITGAKIADANITAAKIADANITNAKIGYAAVDTFKVAGNNVTTGSWGEWNPNTLYNGGAAGYNTGDIWLGFNDSPAVFITVVIDATSIAVYSAIARVQIWRDGGTLIRSVDYTVASEYSITMSTADWPGSGTHYWHAYIQNVGPSGTSSRLRIGYTTLSVFGLMR